MQTEGTGKSWPEAGGQRAGLVGIEAGFQDSFLPLIQNLEAGLVFDISGS